MPAKILTTEVGPWSMNTYVVIDETTNTCAVIDPGDDPHKILSLTGGARVDKILLTHAHADHVGALAQVKVATGAPVYLHPAEKEKFGIYYDVPLADGDIIAVGDLRLECIHTPGHTPGMICFKLDHRTIVGDTLFVGGPGRTWNPAEFSQTMQTMQDIVFQWPDETEFYPGHGPSGVIGQERPAYDAFVARGWPDDLEGDVTWA